MSRAKAVFIPPAELVVVARSSYPMFELPENLRIFRKLFFTKRGRSGQWHRILKTHFPAGAFRVKMCLERPCDCKAMKAPVGLSSRRAVCASRWKGLALTSVEAATNTKTKNIIH